MDKITSLSERGGGGERGRAVKKMDKKKIAELGS